MDISIRGPLASGMAPLYRVAQFRLACAQRVDPTLRGRFDSAGGRESIPVACVGVVAQARRPPAFQFGTRRDRALVRTLGPLALPVAATSSCCARSSRPKSLASVCAADRLNTAARSRRASPDRPAGAYSARSSGSLATA